MKLMIAAVLTLFILTPGIQAEGCTRALVPNPMHCQSEDDTEETCPCGEMAAEECSDECEDGTDCECETSSEVRDGVCTDTPDCECDGTVDGCSGDCHDCDSIEDCDECEDDYDYCE